MERGLVPVKNSQRFTNPIKEVVSSGKTWLLYGAGEVRFIPKKIASCQQGNGNKAIYFGFTKSPVLLVLFQSKAVTPDSGQKPDMRCLGN
jgi:hypothetical protein